MQQRPSSIKLFFRGIGKVFSTVRSIVSNLIFFVLLITFIVLISSSEPPIQVPNGSALVLNPVGNLVEEKTYVDPMDALMTEALGGNQENPEVLVRDIVDVLEQAKEDDRIELLVLHLQNLDRSGLSKLQAIGRSLEDFKASGKKIIAIGDMYTQSQYYLASFADDVWLNEKGFLMLDGFGRYQLYFKSALDKLSISQHIFRVGTYKSAVEPYMRDNMSDEAKAANKVWLNDLWQEYKQDVAKQRNIKIDNFDETYQTLNTKFKAANGSFAEYALENSWVDALKTRQDMRDALIEIVGKDEEGNSFKQIGYEDYLQANNFNIEETIAVSNQVAVVVARGEIVDGSQKAGRIGGDSTAKLLREARFDDNIKAVVLRVDSPGGSAYASEIIRQEVDQLQAAGKPVIASMGSVAASGGYWISTSADKIYASPTTITGSIGIFGMLATFENSLGRLGIFTDGVGTTEFAGFGLTQPMNDGMAELFQTSINRGYQDFIGLVAQHRNMSIEDVDAIAQGRVWSGLKAKELGLVDELGDLEQAIEAAANLAEVTDYETIFIEHEMSAQDQFLQDMLGESALFKSVTANQTGQAGMLLKMLTKEIKQLERFNDPQGIYSFCLTCEAF